MKKKQIIGLLVAIAVAIGISLIPAPEGLEQSAMVFLGVFIGFLITMVVGVAGEHVLVLATLGILMLLGAHGQATVGPDGAALSSGAIFAKAFAAFSNTTTWLVIAGFGISAALAKSGLLKRIALFVLQFFPANYTGQILAMLVTGTIVTPMLPSVNAKAVLMAPLAHEVSKSAGFEKSSAGAGGLFSAAYMPACVFGNAFLTGSLFVALMIGFVPAEEVSHWDFMNILSCTFVWFIIVAVLTFFAIMLLYKPKETIQFEKGYAKAQLKEMGKITRDEIVCGICLIFAIVLWVDPFGLKIDPTVVGLCAFTAICLFGGQAFTVADFGTRIPWRMVILIGGIQAIAGMLSAHKISTWISATIGPIVAPLISNAFVMVLLVIVVVYLLRYVVISQVATATIAFAIFGGLAAVAGINSFFILGFVIYVSGQIWTTPFNNTAEMAARAITNDEMVEHKDTVKMSYAYMVINLIALCASVPLWMALGYIA